MRFDPEETIAAIASAPGGSERGIVRVSGNRTGDVLRRLFQSDDPAASERARRAVGGNRSYRIEGAIRLQRVGRLLPAAVLFWPARSSYTRQDMAEFHTVGSPPLLAALLDGAIGAGARPAQPGEFTLRAFLSGRLDLTRAEAVLGVIDADHPDQLQTALRQLAGGISTKIHALRDQLLDLAAQLEAGLDFADEDIDLITARELTTQLQSAGEVLRELTAHMTARARTETAYRVVLKGPPNSGKSSLFNALVARFGDRDSQQTAALVSGRPGTTRDHLTASLALEGLRIALVDTAGHQRFTDAVSARAQRFQRRAVEEADLLLSCVETARCAGDRPRRESGRTLQARQLNVLTKADLAEGTSVELPTDREAIRTSVVTGEGLDELVRAIGRRLRSENPRCASDGSAGGQGHRTSAEIVGTTAARCREGLTHAAEAIRRASEAVVAELGNELVALEVRLALEELGRVVGAVYTDDILDRVFSRFCIGK